ncbi:carboxylesterase/lipase family protein [Marinimicrobium alkaliphilum]|uniref:carboxylesterase/lipase family protein n=1 Tax=Marinimicrobium alkaliphilum TaxID=2202654 RepID=UPI001E57170C|nr:carboxylesterase/lipase family protein [Marinimicrobium alkaliphilum]
MRKLSCNNVRHDRRGFIRTTLLGTSALALSGARTAYANNREAYPVITTRSGRLVGTTDHGINVFKGIPYGADTGAYRFMAPRREQPWSHTRDALEFGPAAPQGSSRLEGTSEDCLSLNIWTPGVRDQGARPILVYIHGGGYNNGSGADPQYDGVNLCLRDDVVVITVNHRLNAFGYLYLADLGGPAFAHSGNAGQLDLIQALEWVKEHAGEFGGDPNNVTLFGQSGGGAKIITLMAMPAAQGLFHRAFTMSGQQVTAAGPRAATQRAEIFVEHLGIKARDLDSLRTLPAERILEGTSARDPSRIEDNRLYFGPVLDFTDLHRHPFYPDAPEQSRHIPLVIGNTRDETRAFLGGDPANFELTWAELPDKIRTQQYVDIKPEVVIAEYRRLYPDYTPSEVFFAATTAGRSWRGAVIQAEERARQGAPAFVYQLDWGSPREGGRYRAHHSLDIPLVFDTILQPGSPTGTGAAAQQVADQMSEALLAFARTGNPSHSGIPTWQPYSLENRETLVIDTQSRLVNDPRGGERKLYAKAPFIQRGTF